MAGEASQVPFKFHLPSDNDTAEVGDTCPDAEAIGRSILGWITTHQKCREKCPQAQKTQPNPFQGDPRVQSVVAGLHCDAVHLIPTTRVHLPLYICSHVASPFQIPHMFKKSTPAFSSFLFYLSSVSLRFHIFVVTSSIGHNFFGHPLGAGAPLSSQIAARCRRGWRPSAPWSPPGRWETSHIRHDEPPGLPTDVQKKMFALHVTRTFRIYAYFIDKMYNNDVYT